MSDGAPLGRLILRALRLFALVCAGFVVLIIAIEIWKTWLSGAERVLVAADYGFFGVLGLLLAGLVWLARSITRELDKS